MSSFLTQFLIITVLIYSSYIFLNLAFFTVFLNVSIFATSFNCVTFTETILVSHMYVNKVLSHSYLFIFLYYVIQCSVVHPWCFESARFYVSLMDMLLSCRVNTYWTPLLNTNQYKMKSVLSSGRILSVKSHESCRSVCDNSACKSICRKSYLTISSVVHRASLLIFFT